MATSWLPDARPWTRGDPSRRCVGTVKNGVDAGRRCRAFAIDGGTVCAGPSGHGGGAPQVRRAAARRVEQARVAGEVAALVADELARGGTETDGLTVLIERLTMAAAVARVFDHLLGGLAATPYELDPATGVPTGDRREALYGPDHLGDLRPHPLVRMARDAANDAAAFAKLALDAGVEERQVAVAEQLGALMAAGYRHLLDGLDLTDDQRARAPDLVAGAMRYARALDAAAEPS